MAIAEAIPILHKIHSTGYWQINIWPTGFDANRIHDLSSCEEIIRACKVSLDAVEYPFLGGNIVNGQDWIESEEDSKPHVEFWRFYQSGQFVQHLSVREDYWSPERKTLRVQATVHILTQVYEFAARLAEQHVLTPAAQISVTLCGTQGRVLETITGRLSGTYAAGIDTITHEDIYSQQDLIASRNEIALKATMFVFERFNWKNPPEQLLREDQRRLLERRF